MKVCEELLNAFYEGGRSIRRKTWPTEDHIDADGAEGGTIWYYNACEDELNPDFTLDFHDLGADDWEILP